MSSAPANPLERVRPSALDLHEGICDPPELEGGCDRWPEHFRLLNETTGETVLGRCRATNLCRYCQRLYVVETVEMLTLDALEYAPTLWLVLTAREHLTRRDTYAHLRQLRRALRKRWPAVEWFVQVEFQRRGALHLNLLIKGVPVEQVEELRAAAVKLWCSRVDAEPVGQWAGVVQDGLGVVRYLSKMLAHGLKAEQAPPIGWKGHRTSQTRGYLVRPASVMREEARASLADKRRLWKVLSMLDPDNVFPPPAEAIEDWVEYLAELDAAASWRLVQVFDLGRDEDRRRREQARAPFAGVRGATGRRAGPGAPGACRPVVHGRGSRAPTDPARIAAGDPSGGLAGF